jgi:hypothetical protein
MVLDLVCYANTVSVLNAPCCISVFWHIGSERTVMCLYLCQLSVSLFMCSVFMFDYTTHYLLWLLPIKLLLLVLLFLSYILLYHYGFMYLPVA